MEQSRDKTVEHIYINPPQKFLDILVYNKNSILNSINIELIVFSNR